MQPMEYLRSLSQPETCPHKKKRNREIGLYGALLGVVILSAVAALVSSG